MLDALARLLLILALLVAVLPARAENWPQWRGPEGTGTSRESGLPVAWSEHSGVVWKCPLPEWGNSAPIVWEDAVFLTSHVNNKRLVLVRIDRQTGKIVWQREVGQGSTTGIAHNKLSKPEGRRGHQQFHESQNFASPTPATDGQIVVAHFGNGDLAAYDFDGHRLWRRNLQKDYGDYSIWWGHANSPVLCGDLVISACMQDSCRELTDHAVAPSYIVAHDKKTGRERWRTMRMTDAVGEDGDSYATPLLWRNRERTEAILLGSLMLDAYDTTSGKQLWRLPGLIGSRTITGPTAAEGLIFATQGMRKPLLAVKPSGPGVLDRHDIVWKLEQGTPDSVSPVAWGQSLFFATNDGVAKCVDLHSGRLRWSARLKGEYRASPVAAEGRVYFLNTKGLCTVLSASPRLDRLTENQLDDDTLASPAISGGRLFIRGRKALYCVGK